MSDLATRMRQLVDRINEQEKAILALWLMMPPPLRDSVSKVSPELSDAIYSIEKRYFKE